MSSKTEYNGGSYGKFKEYIKKHPIAFWTFFKKNLLNEQMTGFKSNIINDEVIARLFVKDEINWDGKDKDDAILFLMGGENIIDQDFTNTIRIAGNADDFLEQLNGNDKKKAKARKKELEKWKRRSQKGTKEFFTSQQQYLFENGDAYTRFLDRVVKGKNPIDPSDEEAAPASPTKSVETRTAPPEKLPTEEEEKKDETEEEEKKEENEEEI